MRASSTRGSSIYAFQPWRVEWMNELFSRLNAHYMARWKSHFVDEHSVNHWRHEWSEGMNRAQITRHQADQAVQVCIDFYPWPPSLSEFIKACKAIKPPAVRGLPPPRMSASERENGLRHLRIAKEILNREKR